MASYRYATRPSDGEAIAFDHGVLDVHNHVIPYIEGEGTGPDMWRCPARLQGISA
jgi:isocitrate dehydrogenase